MQTIKLHLTLHFRGRLAPMTAEVEWMGAEVPTPMEVTKYVAEHGYLEDPTWGLFSWDSEEVIFFAVRPMENETD